MMGDDEHGDDGEDVPQSDPYCAHWISIPDEDHPRNQVLCENCGKSCYEHPAAGGFWCPAATEETPDMPEHHFLNVEWPARVPTKPRPT